MSWLSKRLKITKKTFSAKNLATVAAVAGAVATGGIVGAAVVAGKAALKGLPSTVSRAAQRIGEQISTDGDPAAAGVGTGEDTAIHTQGGMRLGKYARGVASVELPAPGVSISDIETQGREALKSTGKTSGMSGMLLPAAAVAAIVIGGSK